MKLAVVIRCRTAARNEIRFPPVLQPLAGRPLLGHVVSRARALDPSSMHVVYGHGGLAVREALAKENLHWALQADQLGTGHAVMQAMPNVADDELVLVLYGDVPLIRAETLAKLIASAGPKAMSLLTVMLPDPTGYGRIVRKAGAIQKIVEQKDASKLQLKIREGNSGIMAVPAKLLKKWLGKLKNANAQGEYYLTDIVAMAVKDKTGHAAIAPTVAEVSTRRSSPSSKPCIARSARELMVPAPRGRPARIDIRAGDHRGRDVFRRQRAVRRQGHARRPRARGSERRAARRTSARLDHPPEFSA
jgi:bifunctional UDP-N-acetylglucosamine pyrophosphorylase/glucosamine-1-phosphate N-acetyltransferase